MNQRDYEGLYVCAECGKRFPFSSQTIYKMHNGKTRTYYCSYTCWRKNGGGTTRHDIAGRKIRQVVTSGKK